MPVKPVVILDPYRRGRDEIFAAPDLARLHDLAEVVWGRDEPMPTTEFAAALKHAEAVVVGGWRHGDILDADRAPKVRAILEVSGGFPRELDYGALFTRGVRVLSCAPAFGPQVAEMALAMALAAGREVVSADRAFRAGEERWLQASNRGSFLLYGKPVGFIGYGGLAQRLRPLLAPFGCPISVYDPWLGDGYLRSQGVTPVSLEALLETSRVVFVLAVPSAENRAVLSREMLERIRPGSVLVLISRAHVVDFDALTDLVLAGRFRAAIDVFPSEPFPADHPIRQARNAILSAHRAGSVPEGLTEIGRYVVDDLEAILRGLPPRRMQAAQPELANRYAGNRVPPPK
jgi:phosphoglycerate dehydrogenase-like enzyme